MADYNRQNKQNETERKRKGDSSSNEPVQKKRKVTKESKKSDQTPTTADSKSKICDLNPKESTTVQNDFASSSNEESIKQAKPDLIREENSFVSDETLVESKKSYVVSTDCASNAEQVKCESKENIVKEEILLKEAVVQGSDTSYPDQGMAQVTSKLVNTNSISEADVQKLLKSVLKTKSAATTEGWF